VAVPKFVNLQSDARVSVINGVSGAMQSASALAHAQIIARGVANGANTTIEGVTVTSVFGYPNAASMQQLINLQPITNFVIATTATALTIQAAGAAVPANCQAVYTQPTAVNLPPSFSSSATLAGC